MVIGVEKDGYYISSDVLGFIEKTDNAIYIDNENFVVINNLDLKIFDFNGISIKPNITTVSKEFADVYKGDYAHFTLKEISEQNETILVSRNTTQIEQVSREIQNTKNLYVTGSGSSYNAAEVMKYLLSKFTKIRINTVIASELPFSPETIEQNSTFIAISQSGESADVLESVRIAKEFKSNILSIINHPNSSLSQESNHIVGLNCGPEIKQIKELSKNLKDISDIYVLGRGIHLPIAKEAALKLKELTYIHAEGIPGGELKHGPLALMDSSVYVIIINPDDSTYNDTINSANQIKARGAKIIGVSNKNSEELG